MDEGSTLRARQNRRALAVLGLGAVLATRAPASADCARPLETKPIPLPVWATSPNEGNTWGAMPVFVRVCPDDQHTAWILAPSVTWNSIIHYTGTIRFYDYPDPETTLTVIGSLSTRINYNLLAMWQRLPTARGAWTDEDTLRIDRSAFARFFGLGSDTMASAESSYTRSRVLATLRRGINATRRFNVGAIAGFERDGVGEEGVPDLPLASDQFPDAPGMRGATVLWQGLDVRYDNRVRGDYTDQGLRLEASAAVVEGIARAPTFLRFGAQARGVWPELSWLSGAAHASWAAVTDASAPFYLQSGLGGSFLLRGFADGRFIDRQAWTIEAEQRVRLAQTRMFGVVTDWRMDPFVAAGQVFGDFADALSRPQVAVGVGLRAFVHPNVVGRIDLATGGEGLKVYVEIGYPY